MTRCVNDVDLDPFIVNRYVLGQNGDASLPLQFIVVQDQLIGFFAEGLTVMEDLVNQGRFAMVHVGNDGDVSECAHVILEKRCKGRGYLVISYWSLVFSYWLFVAGIGLLVIAYG